MTGSAPGRIPPARNPGRHGFRRDLAQCAKSWRESCARAPSDLSLGPCDHLGRRVRRPVPRLV